LTKFGASVYPFGMLMFLQIYLYQIVNGVVGIPFRIAEYPSGLEETELEETTTSLDKIINF
jgi:hypothetical protein